MRFMDLEKAYKINRKEMWLVLQVHGVGGKLVRAVKDFYKESKARVRVDR